MDASNDSFTEVNEFAFSLDNLNTQKQEIEITFDWESAGIETTDQKTATSQGNVGCSKIQILSQDLVRSQIFPTSLSEITLVRSQIVADWLQISSLLSWLPKLVLYDQNQLILPNQIHFPTMDFFVNTD